MKKILLFILIFGTFSLADDHHPKIKLKEEPPANTPVKSEEGKSLTITGTITTTNGPIQGARNIPLTLTGQNIETQHTTTDQNGEYNIQTTITALPDATRTAPNYSIKNYPNPFNPHTKIRFSIPKLEDITIDVYTRDGQLVKTLLDRHMMPGTYEVEWDATNNHGTRVAQGLYFYIMRTSSGHTEHGKMVYMHNSLQPAREHTPKPMSLHKAKAEEDSLDMLLTMEETDSTEANQIAFKVHRNGGTYTINGTVTYKNFPPKAIREQTSITTDEDTPGVTSPVDSLFYDFNGQDELTFRVNNLPEGFTAELRDGRLEILAPENYNGSIEGITITASDGQYEAESNPFHLTYTPVNDAPATNVPVISVPRGGETKVDLNNYVTDPDNLPEEMRWQAAGYDTNLVKILIDTLNNATIKSKGSNGSTPIIWTATDPDSANGQNTSSIEIELAYLLTIRMQDPVDSSAWVNDTLLVKTGKQSKEAVTDSSGTARVYLLPDTGRILVPYNTRHYETQQPFERLTKDGTLSVPVISPEYPLKEFVRIQGSSDIGAYVTSWDPALFNRDTLRMVYYDKSESDNKIEALRDTIMSWNEKYFPRMTPGWKLEPPRIGHNVVFYHPETIQDEADKSNELWAADSLPNNAGMYWIISHYGLTPTNATNDIYNNPAGPFYATRGRIITRILSGGGTEFEESATALQTGNGEVKYGEWPKTVYGGGSYWPLFTGKGIYKGKEYVLEVLIGRLKYNLIPGTEVRPTRMILPPKKAGD